MPPNDPEYDKLYKRKMRNTKKFGRKPLGPGSENKSSLFFEDLLNKLKEHARQLEISYGESMRIILREFFKNQDKSPKDFQSLKKKKVLAKFKLDKELVEKSQQYIEKYHVSQSRLFEIALLDFFGPIDIEEDKSGL